MIVYFDDAGLLEYYFVDSVNDPDNELNNNLEGINSLVETITDKYRTV
ncbi:hypothetical protein [Fredinandcohnia onubensis]|nr:hypothetical protein [Fredinandcohnia onubensis]